MRSVCQHYRCLFAGPHPRELVGPHPHDCQRWLRSNGPLAIAHCDKSLQSNNSVSGLGSRRSRPSSAARPSSTLCARPRPNLRTRVGHGETAPEDVGAAARSRRARPSRLVDRPVACAPVINATGVILHTNLGRAPLARAAVERVAALAGYTNLEYDLEQGTRGRRDVHAERLLCHLLGAEAAVVVNNNAAATLLTLAAIAAGREVIVSRGELVEIGGGFRVPDVMAQSGAILREVGTTNRTRTADYAAAIGDRTAAILRVHPSNFRIEGFTARPDLADLVALAHRFNLPVIEDIGSGWIGELPPPASARATSRRREAASPRAPTPSCSAATNCSVALRRGSSPAGPR